jgi:hypothetical protein
MDSDNNQQKVQYDLRLVVLPEFVLVGRRFTETVGPRHRYSGLLWSASSDLPISNSCGLNSGSFFLMRSKMYSNFS